MILDSSALVAVIIEEPGHNPLLKHIADADNIAIGAPTLTETGIVLSAKLGVLGKTLLARFVQERSMMVIAFGDFHWTMAIDAFLRYGKGKHPAGLNFGDCLTYATAKIADQPLLCIGSDFAQTDLVLV